MYGGWGGFIARAAVRKVVYVLVGLALVALLAAVGVGEARGATYSGVKANGTVALTANASTVVPLTNETWDTAGFHSTVTDTSRLTIPTGEGGYYGIGVVATVAQTSSASIDRRITVRRNGSGAEFADRQYWGSTAGVSVTWDLAGTLSLAGGDYIETLLFVNNAGNTGSVTLTATRLDAPAASGSLEIGCGLVASPAPSASPDPSYQPCHIVIDQAGALGASADLTLIVLAAAFTLVIFGLFVGAAGVVRA